MTLKPTTGLAAETESTNDLEDLSDELRVDASEDVTVEAAEDVTTESSTTTHEVFGEALEPTPAPITSFMTSIADPGPTPPPSSLLDVLGPSLPLPGVTDAPSLDESLGEAPADDDVTTLARGGDDDVTVTRPAVTDDDEEETKVEPAETAIHAAALRDDVGTALSEQASYEREKALRKSSPGLFGEARSADSASGIEFADPESDDDEVISAGPVVDEDDDGIVVGGHTRDQHPGNGDGEDDSTSMFGKSADPSPLVAALTARRPGSPPSGSPFRADGFGSARLPTPSPGFAGLSLASPAPVPAPASSPFGKLASVPAPYGSARTTTSSHPALQIPAPSGAAATPTDGAGFLRKVQIPLGFLVTAGLSCVGVGVIVGWLAHGGTPPAPPVPLAAPRAAAPAPTTAPVVQPVVAPEPVAPAGATAAAPSALPAATGNPGTAEPVGAKSAPAAQAEGLDESATRPAVKHPPKPRKPALDLGEDAPAPKQVAAPKPPAPAAKPAKPAGKAGGKKVWVDPFAD